MPQNRSTQENMRTHPFAGQPAPTASLADIPALLAAYRNPPDPADPAQRVAFGLSLIHI